MGAFINSAVRFYLLDDEPIGKVDMVRGGFMKAFAMS